MATSKSTRPRTRKLVQPANGTPHEPRNNSAPPIDPDRLGSSALDADSDRSPVAAGEQDSLMDLLAGFTDAVEVVVKVYRVVRNKPLAYVYECSPETFSMDSLRDDYGGGEFRVYIHRGGELIKNVRVMVEPPRKIGNAMPSELESALAALRDRQDKSDKVLEAIAARLAAPPPAAPGLGSMLAQMDLPGVIGAFGSLLKLMTPPPPPPMPAPAPAADPMAGIEMFMKAFELARELQGDGGGEKSLMGVVSDLIKSPLLAQAVQAGAQQMQPQLPGPQHRPPQQPMMRGPMVPGGRVVQTPMGPVHQPAPAHAPAAEVSHAKLPEGQEMATVDTSAATIMGQMEFLCAQAADGADPELYAGLILDQLDDDTLIRILNMPPDPLTALIDMYPAAEPHREWFAQIIEYVAGAFEETPDPVASGAGVTVATGVELGGQSTHAGTGDATGSDTSLIPGGPPAG